MQQSTQYRDITISYRNIQLRISVPAQEIIGQYFKKKFRTEHNEYFKQKANVNHIDNFTNLQDLINYSVTINTKEITESSDVKNATSNFKSYNKQKRLTFYVHELKEQNMQPSQKYDPKSIEFSLMKGGVKQHTISIDIDKLNYQQFEKKIKQQFKLSPEMQIVYTNLHGGNQINLKENNKNPSQILAFKNIFKVGVCPRYEAG